MFIISKMRLPGYSLNHASNNRATFNSREIWPINDFKIHADTCDNCKDFRYLLYNYDDGAIYSVTKYRKNKYNKRSIRVGSPIGHFGVWTLLKAKAESVLHSPHWPFIALEKLGSANKCNKCKNPYDVYRRSDELCGEGKNFAQELVRYLYYDYDDGTQLGCAGQTSWYSAQTCFTSWGFAVASSPQFPIHWNQWFKIHM
jgi:hypothetical protein